jgi:hypothetical protein
MTTHESFALLVLAAAIHASFQLSVSMLTILSGHALSAKTASKRLLGLSISFASGVASMIALSLALISLLLANIFYSSVPRIVWAAVCGLMVGVGVAIWTYYYRHQSRGTILWLPRGFARYLSERTKKTSTRQESFGLGLVSVIAEYLFCLAPLIVGGLILQNLTPPLQILGLTLYVAIAVLPLVVIIMLLGSGHSLAVIQKWRETNKRFLQFAAGSALVILGGYIYVSMVIAAGSQGNL